MKNIYLNNLPSVNLVENIKITTSVSVLVTRYRDKSIIKFETPQNNRAIFNTTCYLENKEGNDENYFIYDLNFTTPIIKPGDRYGFLCEIRNGEVFKII